MYRIVLSTFLLVIFTSLISVSTRAQSSSGWGITFSTEDIKRWETKRLDNLRELSADYCDYLKRYDFSKRANESDFEYEQRLIERNDYLNDYGGMWVGILRIDDLQFEYNPSSELLEIDIPAETVICQTESYQNEDSEITIVSDGPIWFSETLSNMKVEFKISQDEFQNNIKINLPLSLNIEFHSTKFNRSAINEEFKMEAAGVDIYSNTGKYLLSGQ